MTKGIIKWLALAILVVGLTSFLLGQQVASDRKPLIPQAATSSKSDVGRYQIVVSPGVRADTFLLDTATGKTWVQTAITDVEDEPTVWLYRERLDDAADLAVWSARQKFKKSAQ
jgi:hypothetical protein